MAGHGGASSASGGK
jgi:hypothetical protein